MTMLEGVRVVELGTTITAPLAAMMLADLGATVLKVERPGGDPFRSFRGGSYSSHFVAYNRNKQSVVLDLGSESDRHRMATLLATADVFIDNVRPNALPRMGLEPADLRQRFPRLIHCSITGFGTRGPYRDRPAFDAVAQALSGISSLFFDPANPEVSGPTLSDNITGMYAAYGVLGALHERTRTGLGRRIEVNMLEASMAFIGDSFAGITQFGIEPDRFTRASASQSYAFRCADGRLIVIHLSSIEKFWTGLLEALEAMELHDDERFRTRMLRLEHYAELRRLLGDLFARRGSDVWAERLEEADVPYAVVNTVSETMKDRQVLALDTFFSVEHPTQGRLTHLHAPLLVDGERVTPRSPAPLLGEHVDDSF